MMPIFFSANFKYQRGLDPVTDLGGGAGRDICREHRKLDHVEERRQRILAIVKFMVADGHGVESHLVEEFGLGSALVGGVEQRALEIVAAVEKQHVAAFKRCAPVGNGGYEPCRSAEAFVFAFIFGGTGGFILVVGFDPAVPVVDVQNGQAEIGQGNA
jgi:hypothetical protein